MIEGTPYRPENQSIAPSNLKPEDIQEVLRQSILHGEHTNKFVEGIMNQLGVYGGCPEGNADCNSCRCCLAPAMKEEIFKAVMVDFSREMVVKIMGWKR